MNNKFKNTKQVTFEENFGRFEKGEVAFMRKELAEKLKKSKAKVKIETFDYETAVQKARRAKAAAAEEQAKVNKA